MRQRALITYIQLFVCVKVTKNRKLKSVFIVPLVHECHQTSANFRKEDTYLSLAVVIKYRHGLHLVNCEVCVSVVSIVFTVLFNQSHDLFLKPQ